MQRDFSGAFLLAITSLPQENRRNSYCLFILSTFPLREAAVVPAADSSEAALLEGLRKAAQFGPLPLQATGGANPKDGIFPSGARGRPLADKAEREGLVAELKQQRTETKTNSKGKVTQVTKDVVVGWQLTPAGYEYLSKQDSPKAALEALQVVVSKLATSSAPDTGPFRDVLRQMTGDIIQGLPTTIRTASAGLDQSMAKALERGIHSAFTELEQVMMKALGPAVRTALMELEQIMTRAVAVSVQSAFAGLEQTVMKSLSGSSAVDASPVLAAIRAAAERVEAPPQVHRPASVLPPPVPVPPPPVAPLPSTPIVKLDGASLERDILAYVEECASRTSGGPQFDALWRHLLPHYKDLTVGAFHDALRKLDRERRIAFGTWSKSIPELPDPQLALFVSSKVMYYAHPAR